MPAFISRVVNLFFPSLLCCALEKRVKSYYQHNSNHFFIEQRYCFLCRLPCYTSRLQVIELQGLVRCMIQGVKGVDVSMFTLVTSWLGQCKVKNRCFVLIFAVVEIPPKTPHLDRHLQAFTSYKFWKHLHSGNFPLKTRNFGKSCGSIMPSRERLLIGFREAPFRST